MSKSLLMFQVAFLLAPLAVSNHLGELENRG